MLSNYRYYSGTSNIVLPIKQSQFPPAFEGASRLTYYASLFSSLEVNSSFYKIPRPATVKKWSESVPPNFRFTFKLPKTVTHAKGLQFNVGDLDRFAEAVEQAGSKKGCLLVQLPPSTKSDKQEELEAILDTLKSQAKGWHVAVECRDNSWYNSGVYRMLNHYGAALVEHDIPKSATPKILLTNNFTYLRFHGPETNYRGSYDERFLRQHAKRIVEWLKKNTSVYVYFNNTLGAALDNLKTLNALVERHLKSRS